VKAPQHSAVATHTIIGEKYTSLLTASAGATSAATTMAATKTARILQFQSDDL
jgi:hypothetical protein